MKLQPPQPQGWGSHHRQPPCALQLQQSTKHKWGLEGERVMPEHEKKGLGEKV